MAPVSLSAQNQGEQGGREPPRDKVQCYSQGRDGFQNSPELCSLAVASALSRCIPRLSRAFASSSPHFLYVFSSSTCPVFLVSEVKAAKCNLLQLPV